MKERKPKNINDVMIHEIWGTIIFYLMVLGMIATLIIMVHPLFFILFFFMTSSGYDKEIKKKWLEQESNH